MKSYPKIDHYRNAIMGLECYAFTKMDGSNLRLQWSKNKGWYKFGTRNNMIDRSYLEFGKGIDLFINKYGVDLEKIFIDKYKKVESFVAFCEYVGDNSFSGQHVESDEKDTILFDINQYKRGMIPPKEFIDNFGHLHIPKVIYQGKYNQDLIDSVKNNKYGLKEGVVVKGLIGKEVWMNKIKTNEWLEKVKIKFGEKSELYLETK